MDVTNVFKACVKTVRTRNKALGVGFDNDKASSRGDILRPSKRKYEFNSRAKEIVSNISKLRDYIVKHRRAYINADHLLDSSSMKEDERDQIDADAQTVMKTCSQILREFKQDALNQSGTTQHREHRLIVLNLIESYLKSVCQIYSEQRAIRVRRAFDKQKMLRLEPEQGKSTALSDVQTPNSTTPSGIHDAWFSMDDVDDTPNTEEIQMFEQENQRLYDELSTVADEVRQIEGQVMEISKLQEIFTSKILEQDHDLDRVTDTIIHTTENIKTANEDIREAMKKNASFRAWILFFLIVMAFSLLFLDWYNP